MQKGTTSVLITNLPGFPDGVSLAEDGNFWITLAGTGHQPLVKLLPYGSVSSPCRGCNSTVHAFCCVAACNLDVAVTVVR